MRVQQKMRTWTSTLVSLLLLELLPFAGAQISFATCDSGFEWMQNNLLQDPCKVAAYLISPCLAVPSDATVYELTQGLSVNFYTPPGVNSLAATPCTCNTVLYSMLSACSVCQLESFVAWTTWEESCMTVYVSQFPDTIPPAISVPTWGFLDVTKANNFSVSAAETEADKKNPDIVGNGTIATPIQHSTVSGALSVTPAGFSTPSGFSLTFPSSESSPATATVPLVGQTDPANADTVSGKKKTNVGAIVGGIVGGVGGALLIGGILWYWLTHRKPATSASSATALPVSEASYSAVPPGSPDPEKLGANSSLPLSQPQIHEVASEVQYSQAPPAAAMPLYDPDDPSTFPDVFAASHVPATGSSALAHSTPSPPPASSGSNSGYVPTVY